MNVKEFYEKIGSDYNKVMRTLMNDRFADRMISNFPKDQTIVKLEAAVLEKNIDESFEAAHALKGVTGNLGFYHLYDAVCELTEQLRPRTEEANIEMVEKVKKEYQIVMDALKEYISSK